MGKSGGATRRVGAMSVSERKSGARSASPKLSAEQQVAISRLRDYIQQRQGKPGSTQDIRAARAIIAHVQSPQARQAPPMLQTEFHADRAGLARAQEDLTRQRLYGEMAHELAGKRAFDDTINNIGVASDRIDRARRAEEIRLQNKSRTPAERAAIRQQVRDHAAHLKSGEAARERLAPVRERILNSRSIMGAAHAWHDAWANMKDRGERSALMDILSDYQGHTLGTYIKYDGNAARKLNAFEKAWYQMAADYHGPGRDTEGTVGRLLRVVDLAGGKSFDELPISAAKSPRSSRAKKAS